MIAPAGRRVIGRTDRMSRASNVPDQTRAVTWARVSGTSGQPLCTMQRKPRCGVLLRTAWPCRVGGRYRKQYDAAHVCETPVIRLVRKCCAECGADDGEHVGRGHVGAI